MHIFDPGRGVGVLDSGLGFTEAFPFHSYWRTPFRLSWIINLFETPGKNREFTNQTDIAQVRAILSLFISTADSGIPAATGRDRRPTSNP